MSTIPHIVPTTSKSAWNKIVANVFRVPALGKKNWLFFGAKDAGVQNAVIMAVLQH